jgi:choline oxidase
MTAKTSFDYLVVGGGTAGAIVAARLAEDKDVTVCLLEAGYSDEGVKEIEQLRVWATLLGTKYDYDYAGETQPHGNSNIRHSRGFMLGGCSSHNGAIAWDAPEVDLKTWEANGATGWGIEGTRPYFERLREKVNIESPKQDNVLVQAFVAAAQQAGLPLVSFKQEFAEGVGWFELNKRGEKRESSSTAYLHPLSALPENLTVLTLAQTNRILIEGERAIAVETSQGTLYANREIIVCCGAFNSPKLLLLSGIGAAAQLQEFDIPVVVDLPGVGENLLDHPESVVLFASSQSVPTDTSQFYEAGLFKRLSPTSIWAELMFHFGTETYDLHTKPLGYPTATEAFAMTPNVTHPRSKGIVRLRSSDPSALPIIDLRYFSDLENYDRDVLIAGVRLAREIAQQSALQSWIERELAPGIDVQSDAELGEYVRRSSNSVYHPAGTYRRGSNDNPMAVVDPNLRVRGVSNLRVADTPIFPTIDLLRE